MWAGILAGSAACYLLKVAGLSLPPTVLDRPLVQRVAGFIPVALLAALVAVQSATAGQALTIDARLAGVAFAVVAVARRAPFLVVVFGAAAVAALVRFVT